MLASHNSGSFWPGGSTLLRGVRLVLFGVSLLSCGERIGSSSSWSPEVARVSGR